MIKSTEAIYAIDFGTTNTLVAAAIGDQLIPPLELDPMAEDPTIIRSLLYFPNQDECYYGSEAIRSYCENQGDGRLMRSLKRYLPMEHFVGSWIEDRLVRLEDLIGYFLLEMRKRANECLGQDIKRAIIGRPARFSQDPIQDGIAEYRLKKAAEIAGFEEVEFLAEPLAAAFDLKKSLEEDKTVLVADLGGGTSDFTVIRIGQGPFKKSDVLSMGGISLAGDAIDGQMMNKEFASYFGSQVSYRVPLGSNRLKMPASLLSYICSPSDISQLRRSEHYHFFQELKNWSLSAEDKEAMDRLCILVEDQLGFQFFEEIARTKVGFSQSLESLFSFDYPGIEINKVLKFDRFQEILEPVVSNIFKKLDEVLKEAQLTTDRIDLVYCTGGSSRLPLVIEGLEERFGPEKLMRKTDLHSVISGLSQKALSYTSGIAL